VKVDELHRVFLMAEYRELPMVLASLNRTINSKRGFSQDRVPKMFTLNTGHVTFFYDKLKWLHGRYILLIEELKKRGFQIDPSSRSVDWDKWKDSEFWNDWVPAETEIFTSKERINLRISQKPEWYKSREQIKV
jgi:deoxyribonuclease (pyrimidine dimer)